MKNYRIISNGESFKVQVQSKIPYGRDMTFYGFFNWILPSLFPDRLTPWEAVTYREVTWPYATHKDREFSTRQEAQEFIDDKVRRDERERLRSIWEEV